MLIIKIYEMRQKRKFTIKVLAKKSGISTGALCNYENGKRSPTLEQLRKIAIALDCKMTELFDCPEK